MMIYEGVAFLPNSKSQTEEDSFEYYDKYTRNFYSIMF